MSANQTEAKGIFKSQGSMLQQEGTVLSTKTIRFNKEPLAQAKINVSKEIVTGTSEWYDPLAQTFLVEEIGGCFITKIDIFFKSKDETLPVSIQIREVVNGYPGTRVLPYSEVSLRPDQVNISETSLVSTTFTMLSPVYLQENTEYCFVVFSDSFEYNVWIAELGEEDLETNNIVSKQPYAGVLFKSQNASTWTADQNQDMKFILHKAVFDIDTAGVPIEGEVILNNSDLPKVQLGNSPIEMFSGSPNIRVHHPNHGFNESSKVTIEGWVLANGMTTADINKTHNITSVELDSYLINITSGNTATSTGKYGGDTIIVTNDIPMHVMRPNITEMVLPATATAWEAKTTSAQSIDGNETPYILDTSFNGVNIVENNQMPTVRLIASEDNDGGSASLIFKGTMTSDNRNISPVVDLNRVSCISVANRIDYPVFSTVDDASLSIVTGLSTVNVNIAGHGMADTAVITMTPGADLGNFTTSDLTGDFSITRVDDDNFTIDIGTAATSTVSRASGDSVKYCSSQYKFIPETNSDSGTAVAKYVSSMFTLEETSIGFKLLFTASKQDRSNIEIYYKIQGPYNTELFKDIEYVLLEDADTFVPTSESLYDFREYEYTVDTEDFINIAVKVVMKSYDSTRVPVFDDFRIICLGT